MGLLDKAKALKEAEKKKDISSAKKGNLRDVPSEQKSKQELPEEKKTTYVTGRVIETDFDILYKLVLEKKKVKISEIAAMFKIDKKKAEEWIQILDEHNLARIYYPAMGEPEIRRIDENEKAKQ